MLELFKRCRWILNWIVMRQMGVNQELLGDAYVSTLQDLSEEEVEAVLLALMTLPCEDALDHYTRWVFNRAEGTFVLMTPARIQMRVRYRSGRIEHQCDQGLMQRIEAMRGRGPQSLAEQHLCGVLEGITTAVSSAVRSSRNLQRYGEWMCADQIPTGTQAKFGE